MAAVAFDTLQFARRLIAAGVPEKQAEAQAELMAEAFVYNMDSLVTKDYLDARFAEQEARIDVRFTEQEARIDVRFAEQKARIDARFVEQDARIDARIGKLEARLDERFAGIDQNFTAIAVQFAELKGHFRLIYWMLAVVIAGIVLPALRSFSLI